jgi:hypothetical protein
MKTDLINKIKEEWGYEPEDEYNKYGLALNEVDFGEDDEIEDHK